MARVHGLLLAALVGSTACARPAAAPDASSRPKTDPATLRKELAFSLADHREWAAAVQLLLELSKEHPQDAQIQTMLGSVYREQGLFEQANGAFDRAIRLDPRSAKAYDGRGILREVRGDRGDAALDDFRTAMRLEPDDAGYSNNLGFALCVRGRYAEAAVALQEALQHDPLSRKMRNNLGFVYGKMGDFARAKREFEHGGPEDEVENNLGYAYEQAGNVAEACAHYRQALGDNPLLRVASENARRTCSGAKERSQ